VDQPVGDMPADAVAALQRPRPVAESAPGYQHLGISDLIRAEFPGRDPVAEFVDHFNRGRPFAAQS
jgi:hypothetical protein